MFIQFVCESLQLFISIREMNHAVCKSDTVDTSNTDLYSIQLSQLNNNQLTVWKIRRDRMKEHIIVYVPSQYSTSQFHHRSLLPLLFALSTTLL